MSKGRKVIASILMSLTLLSAMPAIAQARTVYYKGTRVYWDCGRAWGVIGYSKVQSHHYRHYATVNGESSEVKDLGEPAYKGIFVGTDHIDAYWGCLG